MGDEMGINRDEFLKQFSDKETALKVYNVIELAIENEIAVNTDFFVTSNIWKKINKSYDNIMVDMVGVDRKQIAFYPKNLNYQFDYVVLEIEVNNKFKQYEHKDFLGSIMFLNIKRELLGDIFVEDNIAYIYSNSKVGEYIKDHLELVGKNKCVVRYSKKEDFSYKFEEIKINVSSNRLDTFISEITNLSRNKAVEYIESGLVQIDYETCKQKDKKIDLGTIITIRKYGKFLIDFESGKTKKGKNIWVIKKYI